MFWSDNVQRESKQLWLPTTPDFKKINHNSWFSIKLCSNAVDWISSSVYEESQRAKHILNVHHQQAKLQSELKDQTPKAQNTAKQKLTKEERKQKQEENKEKRFAKAQAQENNKILFKEECKKRKAEEHKIEIKKKPKVIKCKSKADLYTEKPRTLTEFNDDIVPLQDVNEIYSRKIILGSAQKIPFLQQFIDSYRFVYNSIVGFSNDKAKCKAELQLENPDSQDLTTHVLNSIKDHPALLGIPANHRQQAAQEFMKARRQCFKDQPMKFKKKDQSTMTIEARTIKFGMNDFKFFPQTTKNYSFEYPRKWQNFTASNAENNDLFRFMQENGALKEIKKGYAHPAHGCKLLYDAGTRKLILVVVLDRARKWDINNDVPKTIALDPGVRKFMTGFSPSGELIEFGNQDVKKLVKIAYSIDKLSSQIDKQPKKPSIENPAKKVFVNPPNKMIRKRLKLHTKIKNLREEMHRKVCYYLCTNYDIIMLPSFESQKMTKKNKRKIAKDGARRMLLLGHYSFRRRLIAKAKQYGKCLLIVNEAWTSKTCTNCGTIDERLGGSETFNCANCHVIYDRDAGGARNILLRSL